MNSILSPNFIGNLWSCVSFPTCPYLFQQTYKYLHHMIAINYVYDHKLFFLILKSFNPIILGSLEYQTLRPNCPHPLSPRPNTRPLSEFQRPTWYHYNCFIIKTSGRYFRDLRFRDFSRVLSSGIESHFETRKVSKNF